MATITGTSGNDFIDPAGNTSGVTGGLPGAGADSILGLDGGDTLNGGDGSDTLDGGTGRDILHGGNGDDVIIVGALSENNDYAYGDAGNDELRGRTTAGVNGFFVYLDGGTGNDTLRGFGIGETIADYRARSGPITAVLGTTGGATLPGGEIDVLDSILHIAGSQGADTITGSSANEVFMAGAGGADSINGGGGTDRIEYYDYLPAAGATTGPGVTVDLAAGRATVGGAIQTLAGIEDVSGSDFDDVLLGDAGANIFRAVAGNDTIDGRDGFDIMRYATAAGLVAPWILSTQAGVNVNLATGIATDPWGFTDRLTSIEGIYGVSGQNDTITGSSVDERFFATTGSDSYTGGGGADRLDYSTLTNAVTITWTSATGGTAAKASGGGTDSFSGIAYFNGSTGADTFNGAITHATAKYYYGAAGNDTISGAGSPFSIADYSNTASTAAIVANLATGKVNDGLGGTDTLLSVVALRGSTNADTILGGAPETSWKIDGGGGADLLDYRAYATPITLTGVTNAGGNAAFFSGSIGKGPGFGTDSFTGIRGIYATVAGDSLQGTADTTGANNFVLRGEAGNDTIDGQGGFNYLDYFDSPNGVDVNLASGVAQDGWGGTDSVAGFTRMRGSDNGNDTLVGTSNGNTFIATRGSDLYNGNGGSDSVDYNGLFRDGFVGPVTVTFTGVAAGLFGYANASVAKPSGATDALTGINTVNATSAADTLFGLQGVAYSWNTAVLRGNAGNDTLYGYGSQANKADYNNSTAAVSLDLAAGTAQDGLGGTDTLIGIVQARASNNNDTMLGAATNDRFISGSSGAHLFNGRGGTNDIMYAGADDVTLDLGTVATADGFGGYQGSIAKTTGIDTALNFANAQGGSGNDIILGSPGNNQLTGASGSNSIDGRAGYDTLNYRYFSNLTAPTHGATVDLKDGIAGTAVNPWDGIDTLLNIEAVTGTQFADDLTGALLAGGVRSFVRGDGGNDVLRAPGTDSAVTADYLNSLTAVTIDLKQGKALDD
ncbi:MAG: beta strand repeat-containing protein, partial [Paracraurococcus sp.]